MRHLLGKRLLGALLLTCCWTLAGHADQPCVVLIHLDDTIQPISAEYMERGLDAAAAQHADAVLIEINTPGGLLESMRQMVSRVIASPVPVIVYVAPSGSRAGSAGFFLLEAADVAAMAPGSNAGAAHPVVEGVKLDDTMKQKLENDTAAFLRAYVARRGRNVQAAEDAVRSSKSYSDTEALQLKLIDLIAPDDASLLNTLDGRTITRFDGSKVVLHTRGAQLVRVDPTLREEILDRLTNPNLAGVGSGGAVDLSGVQYAGHHRAWNAWHHHGSACALRPESAAGALHLDDAPGSRLRLVDSGSSLSQPWGTGHRGDRFPGDWGTDAGGWSHS